MSTTSPGNNGFVPLDANHSLGARKPLFQEYVGAVLFFVMVPLLVAQVWRHLETAGDLLLLAAVGLAGFVLSDFIGGFVHWLFDTWGSPDTPFFGQAFIRHFRVHHIDPYDMCRSGYVATNGNNSLATLPLTAGAFCLPWISHGACLAVSGFCLSLALGVYATNQFHKWAHLPDAEIPAVAKLLQRLHLSLPPLHHSTHHAPPYVEHYCITTGWLNAPLRRVQFFRRLERVITFLTGVPPRRSDHEVARSRGLLE